MKLKSATALLVSSLLLFVAGLAIAQSPPGPSAPAFALPPGGIRPPIPVIPGITARPVPTSPPDTSSSASPTPTATEPTAAPPPTVPGFPGRRRRPGAFPPVSATAAPSAGPSAAPVARVPPTVPPPPVTNITQAAPGTTMREFEAGDYQALPAGARITFNLQDADLPDLIRAIGNITGRRFIIGGKVRQIKATIYSPTKVTAGEAYQAFLSVLNTNGLTVVPSGRYLRIEESTGAATLPMPTFTGGESAPADDRFMTRVHRLRNISAEDASNVLGHFKSRDGDITVYGATNTIVITDTGTNIRRMMQILAEVDIPSVGEQIWVERVHYAGATEITQRISELLGQGAQAGGQRTVSAGSDSRLTRLLADERSNSILIVATERMYLRVLELIRRLDVPMEGDGEIHVHYLQHADADELRATLEAVVGGGRAAAAPAPGSNRGATSVFEGPVRITADKRTNALIINAGPRDYTQVRRVINDLDRARRQVFIEAVVMELSVNNGTKVGGSVHVPLPFSTDTLGLAGFRTPTSLLLPGSLATDQDALTGAALGVRGPYIANTQNIIPGLTLGIPSFGVAITALANSGDADVLGTPSIIATDNSPAEINVGENIPLQTGIGGSSLGALAGAAGGAAGAAGLAGLGGLGLGGFGGFSAPRQDVGTKIRVVPHINDSNEIRLEIEEEISEVGASNQGAIGAVSINKRNAKTTVVVRDQQTVAIGGLIRNAITRDNTRVPILGDLPIIGFLFRQERRTVSRRNLLLFLTPYVIRDQSDLRRIFERKLRERQEFLDRYFVFSESQEYQPPIDYTRTNGLVEEIRQSIRELRVQSEIESRGIQRIPPPHEPSEPIELPAELRGRMGGGPVTPGAPPAAGAPPPTAATPPASGGPAVMPRAVPVVPGVPFFPAAGGAPGPAPGIGAGGGLPPGGAGAGGAPPARAGAGGGLPPGAGAGGPPPLIPPASP